MKSFFKKVALLLVLAMVVTMLPAKAASAALDDDGLYMRSKLTLYLGRDASDTIGDFGYATVKYDRDIYTSVRFVSSNPEVAEVGSRKGGVTALAVGEATVTATFTTADGTTQERNCKVSVKQNAKEVWVSERGEAKLKELTVGDELQLYVGRNAKDETVPEAWNQKGAITDGIRFASSDEGVFTVGPTKGGVKAVGKGKAYLYVWAVEGQKQNGGVDNDNPYFVECKNGQIAKDDPCYDYYKYLRTTEEVKVYEVVVIAEDITAKQTTHEAFEVTFPTVEQAEAAKSKTEESLTKASAAVTEDTDIINVYEVLKNTTEEGERVSRMIGGVSVKDDVVTVKMFNELKEDTDYIITYQGKVATIHTVEHKADTLRIVSETTSRTETSSQVRVDYRLYVSVSEEQLVDITSCSTYGNGSWKDNVELNDLNEEKYNPNYLIVGRTIDFYTVDKNNTVTLRAVYEDWSQLTDGKPKPLADEKTISAADSNIGNVKLASTTSYAVIDVKKGTDVDHDKNDVKKAIAKFEGEKKAFAATDLDYRLVVYATREVNGDLEGICSAEDLRFTFVSANEDKLIVGEEDGYLYPAKEPRNDKVSVYVYYDGEYIGTCPITIWAERKLDTFTAAFKDNNSTLSYNPSEDVDDTLTLELKPLDQLGDIYEDVELTAEVYNKNEAKYLDLNRTGDRTWDITGTSALEERTIHSIRILCTASYTDDNGNKKEMKYAVTLRAKNTHDATEVTYRLVSNGNNDLAVKDDDGFRVSDKNIVFAAYSYDKDGFRVKHLSLTYSESDPTGTNVSGSILSIMENNKPVPKVSENGNTQITNVGRDVMLATATVTGSSEAVTVTGPGEDIILKIKDGTYVARLFVPDRNGKAVYRTNCTVTLTDSQSIGWTWVAFSFNPDQGGIDSDIAVANAIRTCFNFTDNVPESNIYVLASKDDYVVKGNLLTIKRVRCILPVTIGGHTYYYEMTADVNRTISMNN